MLGFLEFSHTFFFLIGIKKKKKKSCSPCWFLGSHAEAACRAPVQKTGQTLASMLEVGAKLTWLQTPACAPSWWPGLRAPV